MYINLKTYDGTHFVSAENGGGGQVDATRIAAAQWETWEVAEISGLVPITNGSKVHLRTYDESHFLCAEGGGGGVIDATATSAQQPETFTIVYAPGQSGALNTGTQFHLQTSDGVHFVSAEGGGGGAVDATRTSAQQWETFTAINRAGMFPQTDDSGAVEINNDSNQWMQTSAQLSQSGLVTATTHTWTNSPVYGFTGGVMVLAFDGADNVLAKTGVQTFGVDATTDIFSSVRGSRTDPWSEQLSGVNAAAYIKIATFYAPHNRLLGDLNTLIQIGSDLASVVAAVAKIAGSLG
jgi:hypothetical protein